LIDQIRKVHAESEIFGQSQKAMLDISDELLLFIVKVLRQDPDSLVAKFSLEEWDNLLNILAKQSILSLFYWRVCKLPRENQPPAEILNRMRNSFLQNSMHNLQMENQLKYIAKAFGKEGIRFLLYKGIALARSVYPELTLRPGGCDLDLLVLPKDVMHARKALEALGYSCTTKRFEKSQEIYCEDLFQHKDAKLHKFTVEIHWDLHFYTAVTKHYKTEDFFSRAAEVKAAGFSFETLSNTDALIQAVLHMTIIHNQEMRLSWICDIALLLERLSNEEWELLRRTCGQWQARIALEKCIKLAEVWFGAMVPPEFSDFSKWPPPTEAEITFWESSLGRHDDPLKLFKLHSLPKGFLAKVRLFFHIAFPAPARMRQAYPPPRPWLLPLSYIQRWVRWIKPLFVKKKG
jgi:hypothetical protein